MKATAEWFPARERGLAGGVFNIGASVGSMLAPPLVAWAILSLQLAGGVRDHRRASAWCGWCCGCCFYDSPERHPRSRAAERDYIASGQEKHLQSDGTRPSLGQILRQRNFWGIALPRFLADPTWGTLTFWVPLYLSQRPPLRPEADRAVRLDAVPGRRPRLHLRRHRSACALQKRGGVSLINARRCAFTLGAVLMMGVGFVGLRREPLHRDRAPVSLGGFAHQTLSVTVITMSSDLFKRNEVATVAGMAGTCGNAGLLIFSLLIGGLVATVGYTPFFVCLGVLDLVGAAVLWTVVRERRRPTRRRSRRMP